MNEIYVGKEVRKREIVSEGGRKGERGKRREG